MNEITSLGEEALRDNFDVRFKCGRRTAKAEGRKQASKENKQINKRTD